MADKWQKYLGIELLIFFPALTVDRYSEVSFPIKLNIKFKRVYIKKLSVLRLQF